MDPASWAGRTGGGGLEVRRRPSTCRGTRDRGPSDQVLAGRDHERDPSPGGYHAGRRAVGREALGVERPRDVDRGKRASAGPRSRPRWGRHGQAPPRGPAGVPRGTPGERRSRRTAPGRIPRADPQPELFPVPAVPRPRRPTREGACTDGPGRPPRPTRPAAGWNPGPDVARPMPSGKEDVRAARGGTRGRQLEAGPNPGPTQEGVTVRGRSSPANVPRGEGKSYRAQRARAGTRRTTLEAAEVLPVPPQPAGPVRITVPRGARRGPGSGWGMEELPAPGRAADPIEKPA
ncbi:MAG: hypothetical protein RL653_3375 [Pseudomonadota bacterium]|jgi:hypothetical protein